MIIFDDGQYQIFTNQKFFNEVNYHFKPGFGQYYNVSKYLVNQELDTLRCYDELYQVSLNQDLIFSLLDKKKCWIFDLKTQEYVKEAVIVSWHYGNYEQNIGAGGVTLMINNKNVLNWECDNI
jgi:hypothetical protein